MARRWKDYIQVIEGEVYNHTFQPLNHFLDGVPCRDIPSWQLLHFLHLPECILNQAMIKEVSLFLNKGLRYPKQRPTEPVELVGPDDD